MMCECKHIWNTHKKKPVSSYRQCTGKSEKKHDLYLHGLKCGFGEGCDMSGFYQYYSDSGNTRHKEKVCIQKWLTVLSEVFIKNNHQAWHDSACLQSQHFRGQSRQISEFWANVVQRSRSRLTRTTLRNLVSKKQKWISYQKSLMETVLNLAYFSYE